MVHQTLSVPCGTATQTQLTTTTGANLRLGPVKLEFQLGDADPAASYQQDLSRAQRYYEKTTTSARRCQYGWSWQFNSILPGLRHLGWHDCPAQDDKGMHPNHYMYAVTKRDSGKVRDVVNAFRRDPYHRAAGDGSFSVAAHPRPGRTTTSRVTGRRIAGYEIRRMTMALQFMLSRTSIHSLMGVAQTMRGSARRLVPLTWASCLSETAAPSTRGLPRRRSRTDEGDGEDDGFHWFSLLLPSTAIMDR